MRISKLVLVACLGLPFLDVPVAAGEADLILHNGKILTVGRNFSVAQAMAVENGRIIRVSTDADVLQLRGANTRFIDLKGKTVVPGLIDSHVHPVGASM